MPPTPPRRTWFTTLLGVAAILLGGLASLFSAFALLMALGKPYANSTSDPLGIFLIFILPPGTFLAGIGLLFRQRWARWWMILLMAGGLAFGVKGLVAPAYEESGVAEHYSDSLKQYLFVQSVVCIVVGGLGLLSLLSAPVRREFHPSTSTPTSMNNSQWRVGHQGRDMMYYEEDHHGIWQRIAIDGEMLTGRAHHVIYFADEETWRRYPEWARGRRDEIITRIKSHFREPDYEYAGGGTASTSATTLPVSSSPSKSDGSILPALILLLGITAVCFWFAAQGMKNGETRLPARFAGNHRIAQNEKPALFWTSVGLMGGIGTASAAAATWLMIHRIRRS